MSKIIFKRLTVKEEARVTAGDNPSDTNDPTAADRPQCGRYTVGDPCIVTELVNCEQALSDNQCTLNINERY